MLKYIIIKLITFCIPLCLIAQNAVPVSLLSSGTGRADNNTNLLSSTVGHYSTGVNSSDIHEVYTGFWYLLGKKLPVNVEVNSGDYSTFLLNQNFPNPFSSKTEISFSIPQNGIIAIYLYDCFGNKVGEIINQHFSEGSYTITFSANELPNGVYFYRANFKGNLITQKMIIAK